MHVDPTKPNCPLQGSLCALKGTRYSCALWLYERGFFPKEELKNLPRAQLRVFKRKHERYPGVDMSTGSLGQCFQRCWHGAGWQESSIVRLPRLRTLATAIE